MISHYLDAASSFAGNVDNLILLILLVVGFWGLLAEIVLFGLIIRFSAREGGKAKYITGEKKSEKRWVSYPHYATLAFDVLLIVAALRVWNEIKIKLPKADETVQVISQQWAWTFIHPGLDNKLGTADDIRTVDELRVEVNKTYHFQLTSRDVLHSFSIPAFRFKQDAVPGRIITGWFQPTRTGQYDIQCAEICGIGHALMPARIIIEDAEAHATWLKEHSPLAAATNPGGNQ